MNDTCPVFLNQLNFESRSTQPSTGEEEADWIEAVVEQLRTAKKAASSIAKARSAMAAKAGSSKGFGATGVGEGEGGGEEDNLRDVPEWVTQQLPDLLRLLEACRLLSNVSNDLIAVAVGLLHGRKSINRPLSPRPPAPRQDSTLLKSMIDAGHRVAKRRKGDSTPGATPSRSQTNTPNRSRPNTPIRSRHNTPTTTGMRTPGGREVEEDVRGRGGWLNLTCCGAVCLVLLLTVQVFFVFFCVAILPTVDIYRCCRKPNCKVKWRQQPNCSSCLRVQEDELLRTYEEEALPLHWTDVEKLGKSDTLHDTVRQRRQPRHDALEVTHRKETGMPSRYNIGCSTCGCQDTKGPKTIDYSECSRRDISKDGRFRHSPPRLFLSRMVAWRVFRCWRRSGATFRSNGKTSKQRMASAKPEQRAAFASTRIKSS